MDRHLTSKGPRGYVQNAVSRLLHALVHDSLSLFQITSAVQFGPMGVLYYLLVPVSMADTLTEIPDANFYLI